MTDAYVVESKTDLVWPLIEQLVDSELKLMRHLILHRLRLYFDLAESMQKERAAAPSAPQADRRTNYVSGSVDSTGRFQPTQQGDTSAPQGEG